MRVIDEANTGDTAFRTKDDRTAYALAFYRFSHDPTSKLQTDADQGGPGQGRAGGRDRRRHRRGRARGRATTRAATACWSRSLLGALGALVVLAFVFASFLAFLPLVVAVASILTTFILLLPLTYRDRRVVHRRVPRRADRPRRRDRLLADLRHALAGGARPRPGQPRRRRHRDGDGRPRGRVQRRHRGHRPARARRPAGAVHAQHRHRRRADPAGQRAHHADPDAGDPRRHRAPGRLAEDPAREHREPVVEPLGARRRASTASSRPAPRSSRWACCSRRSSASRSAWRRSDSLAHNGPGLHHAPAAEGRRRDHRHPHADGGAGRHPGRAIGRGRGRARSTGSTARSWRPDPGRPPTATASSSSSRTRRRPTPRPSDRCAA